MPLLKSQGNYRVRGDKKTTNPGLRDYKEVKIKQGNHQVSDEDYKFIKDNDYGKALFAEKLVQDDEQAVVEAAAQKAEAKAKRAAEAKKQMAKKQAQQAKNQGKPTSKAASKKAAKKKINTSDL